MAHPGRPPIGFVKAFCRQMWMETNTPSSKAYEIVARALGYRTWAALLKSQLPPSRKLFDRMEIESRAKELGLKSAEAIEFVINHLPRAVLEHQRSEENNQHVEQT